MLGSMNHTPSDEELFAIIHEVLLLPLHAETRSLTMPCARIPHMLYMCVSDVQVDEDSSGEIDFMEFCNVILKHKAATSKNQDEADTLDAFVALGGNVRTWEQLPA